MKQKVYKKLKLTKNQLTAKVENVWLKVFHGKLESKNKKSNRY